jgi:hypothetical protein
MPRTAALEALLKAYREEIRWLKTKAENYEKINPLVAADYVHRARDLQTVIDNYDRVSAQETRDAQRT